MSRLTCLLLLMASAFLNSPAATAQTSAPAPPVARKVPKVDVVHGDERLDNYYWLREKENPEVRAYLDAENAYVDAVMEPTRHLQEKLYQEMLARIQETDLSVPYRKGGYFYYSRTEKGQQYPIYCRKKGALEAAEEVLLDLNEMAKGEKFMAIGAMEASDDGQWLAYSVDNTGFRQYVLHVKNLKTGEVGPERIPKTVSLAWAADNQTLFYTVEDAAKRSYRVHSHRVGQAEDALVYEELDEMFNVDVERSRSRAYLFLTSGSLTTSEVRYLDASTPGGAWSLLEPRRPGHEYYVEHRGDRFYIRSNRSGRNFALFSAPVSQPEGAHWQEIVAHRPDVMLEDIALFRDYSVASEREDGLTRLRITDLRTGKSHRIEFPEPAYTAGFDQNREFDTKVFRYNYQSLVTPRSIYDYDMEKRESKLLKRTPVLGGFDPANYRSERIFATAEDGARIPIALVYRKGFRRDGTPPMLLYGYGAYGWSLPDTFNSNRFSLIDRGAVFAIAHIRGGGEMGKAWHDQGRMLHKKNTFTDFIAAAEHLVAEKYTSKERLVIEGRSAGGLLMGAVTNMRPDLFRAVILGVPFVDVINTMLDASVPLTVAEFEEWGNPAKRDEYEYMKTYCPYTNLAAKNYPAILVRTSFNDSQVMYWEPAKYVAKLRALKTDKNELLFKTLMVAGHGGASGRYDYLRDVAFDYAFVLGQMGIGDAK